MKDMDLLQIGETYFIEFGEIKNMKYPYLQFHRRGKKFMTLKQAIGYSYTRQS